MEQNEEGLMQLVQSGIAIQRIENENQVQIAVQRPRNMEKVIADALAELESFPEFAAKSYYVIPYKDRSSGEEKTVEVSNIGIHGAVALARLFGNQSSGGRVIGEVDEDRIAVEGVFVDYETNSRYLRQVYVSKFIVDRKTKTKRPLFDNFLTLAIQSGMSKAIRNAILAGFPVALKERYYLKAREVAAKGIKSTAKGTPAPIGKRREVMFETFLKEFAVPKEAILKYLQVEHDEKQSAESKITEQMIGRMIGVLNALREREATIQEVFGLAPAAESEASQDVKSILNGILDHPAAAAPAVFQPTATEEAAQKSKASADLAQTFIAAFPRCDSKQKVKAVMNTANSAWTKKMLHDTDLTRVVSASEARVYAIENPEKGA